MTHPEQPSAVPEPSRGPVGRVVDSRAVRLPLSDHLALVVDLAEITTTSGE